MKINQAPCTRKVGEYVLFIILSIIIKCLKMRVTSMQRKGECNYREMSDLEKKPMIDAAASNRKIVRISLLPHFKDYKVARARIFKLQLKNQSPCN